LFEVFENIVGRYVDAALAEVEKGSERDQEAIEALSGGGTDENNRIQIVADWIRLYKVHRVKWSAREEDNDEAFADAVARQAINHFRTPHQDLSIPERYRMLRAVIEEVYLSDPLRKERSFKSLTSKVLWCRYPEEVPIYDRFAVQSVTFLAKLYKSCVGFGRYALKIEEATYSKEADNWDNMGSAERDWWWYRDFCHSHTTIYKVSEDAIRRHLVDRHRPEKMAFRTFDKILWIMGNEDLDYSLMNVGWDRW